MIHVASELTRRGYEALASGTKDGEKVTFNLPTWAVLTLSLTVLFFFGLQFMVRSFNKLFPKLKLILVD